MYDISLIKSRISCVSYAQKMGLPIAKSGDRCISPFREGAKNPTSFIVFDEYAYDYASGVGYDVIELCAMLAHNGDRGAAIRELARMTGVASDGFDGTAEWLSYTNHLNAQTAFYHSQLTEEDREYLRSRGIKDEDTDRLMIGRVTDGALKGRLFLPYFSGDPSNGGYVCYYATRVLPGSTFQESKYMKQKRDAHNQHLPWGLHTLHRKGDTLVIAEGFFDAASYDCEGYPVLSAITGNFSKDQIPVVLSLARKFSRVFIVYDDDSKTSNAGAKFTERMASLLTRNRIPFVVGTVPSPYHDVSEYYAAGGDLSRIIDAAQDGVHYIASQYADFDELSKFVYTVARHTKRVKMDALLSHLKRTSSFDTKLLDSLFRAATTAPPETVIADEILHTRQLLYVSAVGFYEYISGVWKRLSDDTIRGYADRAYGEFSTAQRVNAICNLLKTRALRDVTFDRRPVWNFVNGTLDLDTGVFREHNPGDYCSIQADYPYNPSADCPAWEKFIADVTGDDPKKSELLQFIPGYALFQDCPHEKVFVLTGSGGNGKSRYLSILEGIFGTENVSHVTPRGLLDKFQRIKLKDSIMNIAGEIKSDMTDAEEYIKQIASGERQSACYKSKDYVDFNPRAKLVYACNGQLASGDTSDGLARRLIIIDFKMRFVDNPNPKNRYQRQKDIYILDALTEELQSGGIFNWVYAGYKLLKDVGYFTETNDQETLMDDFSRASNPVKVFWEDEYADQAISEITYSQIYSDYVVWCGNSGNRPYSSQKFHIELKNLLSETHEAAIRSVRIDGKPRKQRFYRLRSA